MEMRDYRNRKRLAEFKFFIFLLKDKIASGEVVLKGEAQKEYQHFLRIYERI